MAQSITQEKRNWQIHLLYVRHEFDECLALIEAQLKENKLCEYAIYVKGGSLCRCSACGWGDTERPLLSLSLCAACPQRCRTHTDLNFNVYMSFLAYCRRPILVGNLILNPQRDWV